ncbi:MAG: Rap1a/Tai family immunity protein [Vicinamibacterales bacterium]
MKQLSKWVGVLVIALLVTTRPTDISHATQGRTGSGHELQRDCGLYFEFLGRTGAGREETFEVDPFGMGYCAGLVRGVADSAGTLMGDRVCVPGDITAAQAVWVVVQYLRQHPDVLYESDTALVFRALQSAFPCR